uniref:Uncharacterized protein n=1 Tax=Branchiostoma floridae TaxID=7739 RepID=C3YVY8_BRAFL|eukprot:XP_002599540.1 hypothetical protein BRAFLDRAFT_121766 [Branchiostoma floridae]
MEIEAAPLGRSPCPGCSAYLMEPFIKCAQCKPPVLLCLQCFARGFEKSGHESDHRYEIITNEFPVFDLGWTAVEELKLLEALGDCGIGNWQEISNNVGTKSAGECESHYLLYYVGRARPPLPVFEEPKNMDQLSPVTAKLSEDPPRPAADSARAVEMAGYMPARGDFTEEFNNFAEWDIKDIYFLDVDDDLLRVYDKRYNRAVRDMKDGLRPFLEFFLPEQFESFMEGLILYDKRYNRAVRDMKDGLRPFLEFFLPEQFESFMEGLISGHLYEKLRRRREEELGRRHMLTDVLSNMQMCANVRFLPEAFFEYKDILQREAERQGGLRLAQARQLLKIDVNKTRKLFDFLIQEGAISKPD